MAKTRIIISDYSDVLKTKVFDDELINIQLLRCVKLAQCLVDLIVFFENDAVNVDFLLAAISKSEVFRTFVNAANKSEVANIPELGIRTLLNTRFASLTEKRNAIVSVRHQLTQVFHDHWDPVPWKSSEILLILDMFDKYLPYHAGSMNLNIAYKERLMGNGGLTLLGFISKQDVFIELMREYPQLVGSITKEALNAKLGDSSSPLACFCFSGREETDRTSYRFFSKYPDIFQKIEIDEFKRISQYLTPLNFGIAGKNVVLHYSVATLMCEQGLDSLFDTRLHDAIDDAFINTLNNLLLLMMTGYFLRHPEKIKQIKSSVLQQVIPGTELTVAELCVTSSNMKIQEYLKLEPALINEFDASDRAALLNRYRHYFKLNGVKFSRKAGDKEPEKKPENATSVKSSQVKKLSPDELKLKKSLLDLGFVHYQPDELKPNGFTTTQREKLIEVQFKFSDKDVIDNVLNEFIDEKVKNKFTHKIIEHNKNEFDFFIIGSVDDIMALYASVLHKDKQNIRKRLLALGYTPANLQSEQVKGVHISIEDKLCRLTWYGYKAADVSIIMKVKNTKPYANIKAILGDCAAGGLQLLTLHGKTTMLFDLLQNGGEQLKYTENQPTAKTSKSKKKKKKKKVTPTIDATVWDSIIRAAFHQTALQINYHQEALKPYIEINLPQLNTLWTMRDGDEAKPLLVTASILRKTLLPGLQQCFSDKVKIDDTEVGKVLIYPEKEKPTLKPEVNKNSLNEIVTLNQSRAALIEEAFDKAKYERFFNTVFCHASGLKVSWVCKDDVYIEIFHPPLDAAWEVEDVNKATHNFYVKREILELCIMQRISSHLNNVKISQGTSGYLKIFVRAKSIDFDTTALHQSVYSDLFEANKTREEEILGISIKGSKRVKFVMQEFKHQSSQEKPETASGEQVSLTSPRKNPGIEASQALKAMLYDVLPQVTENHKKAFSVSSLQINYETSNANSFGCLRAKDFLNIALDVINKNELFKDLPKPFLSCAIEGNFIHIKLMDKAMNYIEELNKQLPQISKAINEQYEQVVQEFIDERMKVEFLSNNIPVQAVSSSVREDQQSNQEKADNFFVSFSQAMRKLQPNERELLTYHYTQMRSILNTPQTLDQAYYHQVYRAHIVRFLALIGEMTNNHNHLNLVRDFVRHDLRNNTSNKFKQKCQPFIKLIADFAQACPASNDFSIHIFQQLYVDYASNLTNSLSAFANLDRKQSSKARFKRRDNHAYLQSLLSELEMSHLTANEKRDATLSILSDIGESTSEQLIEQKGEEKDFFALCKQVYQVFGHQCFDVDYDTFANQQYQLYLDYLKSKNPSQKEVVVEEVVGASEVVGLSEQSMFSHRNVNVQAQDYTMNPNAQEYVPISLRNTQHGNQ